MREISSQELTCQASCSRGFYCLAGVDHLRRTVHVAAGQGCRTGAQFEARRSCHRHEIRPGCGITSPISTKRLSSFRSPKVLSTLSERSNIECVGNTTPRLLLEHQPQARLRITEPASAGSWETARAQQFSLTGADMDNLVVRRAGSKINSFMPGDGRSPQRGANVVGRRTFHEPGTINVSSGQCTAYSAGTPGRHQRHRQNRRPAGYGYSSGGNPQMAGDRHRYRR